MVKKYITLSIVLVLLACGSVSADLVAVGAPQAGNSWTQDFTVSDSWVFDWTAWNHFDALSINTTATLLNPATTIGSMTVGAHASHDVWATAKNVQSVPFSLHFGGAVTDPLAFDLTVYDWGKKWRGKKGGWVRGYYASGSATASWDGASWSIVDTSALLYPNGDPQIDSVPVPGAVLLGVIGLGVVGMKLRKCA
ncbi:MAG: hypothetical protein ACYSWQ_07245 [Planctomycetota bacterium]|jgi:hypothetical protein